MANRPFLKQSPSLPAYRLMSVRRLHVLMALLNNFAATEHQRLCSADKPFTKSLPCCNYVPTANAVTVICRLIQPML